MLVSKKQASLEIAALYERNGHARLPNIERRHSEGAQVYKKGYEIRLTANSKDELARILELLRVLDFKPGRPYAKGPQFRIPIYGRAHVARFLALVAQHSEEDPSAALEACLDALPRRGRSPRR